MPSQRRPYDSRRSDDDDSHEDSQPPPPSGDDGGDGGGDESDSSYEDDGSEDEPKGEYVPILLPNIRNDVQCPICLGIIRKTRTVMECLHRFCRACIDKSMRLGNNECPACRKHCASRRSLRDDPRYDALISAMFPDIDRYEEEELAFHKEEKARNEQIQASIAETIRRQTEALGRKRTTGKTPAPRRSQSLQRNGQSRGKRNHRTADIQGFDDSDDANGEEGKSSSSSAEEQSVEVRTKRYKRARGLNQNGIEVNIGSSSGLVAPSERLAWGKGGIRSNTRYGCANGGNGKSFRKTRIHKLIDHLRRSEENNNELNNQLMLVPLNNKTTPSLQQPYLCCRPTLSVKQLQQYVALQTSVHPEEVEIYLVKELNFKVNFPTSEGASNSVASMMDSSRDNLQILEENDTLAGLQTHNFMQGNLLLVYKQKISDPKSQPNSHA